MVVSSNISESQLPQEKESISVKEATSNHPIYTKKNDSIDLVKIDSKQSLSKVKEPYNVKEDTSRPSLDSVNHDHVGIIANNPKDSFVVMPKTIETTQALRSTEKIDSGLVQGTAGLSNGTVEELKPVKDLQQEDKLAQSTAEPIINSESINQERLTRPLKRARTAYFIFQDEKRPQVQAEVRCFEEYSLFAHRLYFANNLNIILYISHFVNLIYKTAQRTVYRNYCTCHWTVMVQT